MATILGQTRSPFRSAAYQYIRESDKLPRLGCSPASGRQCRVKLFNPGGIGTWYIAEYEPETGDAFGVADIHEPELGYFNLRELVAFRGRFGLPIERDLHWTPTPSARLV